MADPLIELVAAASGSGTQAYVNTNLGEEPNAVLMLDSRDAVTLNSVANEAQMATGMATGLSSRAAVQASRRNGQTSAVVGRRNNTSAILNRTNTSSSADRGILDFSSFSNNTFTGTWDTASSLSGFSVAMLMKMDNVDMTTITPTSSGVSISPGFDIDVAIIISANGGDSQNNANSSWGFVTRTDGLKQCFYCNGSGEPGQGEPNAYVSNSRCGGQILSTGGGLNYDVTASFPSASQITLTTSTNPSDQYHVLCLNIGTGQAWTGVVDTPTSLSNHIFTGPGFTPIFNWLIMNGMTAVDTARENSAEAGSWGHSMVTDNDQFSLSNADENNSATTDTQTLMSTAAVEKPDDDGSTDWVAAYVGMTSTGLEVNPSAVNASVLKWPMLTIGAADVAGGDLLLTNRSIANYQGIRQ